MKNKNNKVTNNNNESRVIKATKSQWKTIVGILFEMNISVPNSPLNWDKLFNSRIAIKGLDFNQLIYNISYNAKCILMLKVLNSLDLSLFIDPNDTNIELIGLKNLDLDKLSRSLKEITGNKTYSPKQVKTSIESELELEETEEIELELEDNQEKE